MPKTFYSVDHGIWGSNTKGVKWFENLKEAKEFSSRDYSDNVVTHNFKKAEKIAEVEEKIAFQNLDY